VPSREAVSCAGPISAHPRSIRIRDRQNAVALDHLEGRRLSKRPSQRFQFRHRNGPQIQRPFGMTAESNDRQSESVLARVVVLLNQAPLLERGEQTRRGRLVQSEGGVRAR